MVPRGEGREGIQRGKGQKNNMRGRPATADYPRQHKQYANQSYSLQCDHSILSPKSASSYGDDKVGLCPFLLIVCQRYTNPVEIRTLFCVVLKSEVCT